MEQKDQISRISSKLQSLLKQYDHLLRENEKLKKENLALMAKQEEQSRRTQELEQSVAVLKTLSGKMDTTEKKELEKRLNGYIREIDRCISLLGE
jgi:archaellum component FlaC